MQINSVHYFRPINPQFTYKRNLIPSPQKKFPTEPNARQIYSEHRKSEHYGITPQREIRPLELHFLIEGAHIHILYCFLHAVVMKLVILRVDETTTDKRLHRCSFRFCGTLVTIRSVVSYGPALCMYVLESVLNKS
jgi:hypothetical protein